MAASPARLTPGSRQPLFLASAASRNMRGPILVTCGLLVAAWAVPAVEAWSKDAAAAESSRLNVMLNAKVRKDAGLRGCRLSSATVSAQCHPAATALMSLELPIGQ